jgi:hypothetical protein
MLRPWTGDDFMGARVASCAIAAIQVIRWMAIIIVMGMISTVIGAGIYESLRTQH